MPEIEGRAPGDPPPKLTLIVEDDRPTRMLLGRILRARGHEVIDCGSAEQGLEAIRERHISLILLDIQLPGMSGLEFARHVRARPEGDSQYILVGTGNSRPEDLREILAAKPYHPGLLDVRLTVAESALLGIARRKALEEELLFLARHDPLTKLMNRHGMGPAIEDAIEKAGSSEGGSLLYIDLDNFKIVNDTLGHDIGDSLLVKVADILRSTSGGDDRLVRFGGDEFVVIMPDSPPPVAMKKAEAMRESLAEIVYVAQEKTLRVGASIGIAPIDGKSSASEVMGAADEACYAAKARGRNCVEIHSPETGAIARLIADTDWTTRIRSAMSDGALKVWFQPVIDLQERRCFAQEMLLRYRDSVTGETINPAAFLEPLARAGQMARVDRFVIARAFQELASHPGLVVSVNVSGDLFGGTDYCTFVESMLEESDIEPSRILFEITENEMIANLPVASQAIRRLQAKGIRFGLDDFGSGFSSLSYLQSLPIDFIKVDGSFTRDIAREPFQQALMRAVVGIADVLRIGVAAEFVETLSELSAVRALGVRYAQGHLLGRPREKPFDAGEIEALLAPLGLDTGMSTNLNTPAHQD